MTRRTTIATLVLLLLPGTYRTEADAVVPLTFSARATIALAAWMAAWWLTEAIDLAATALLPLALFPLLGIDAFEAASGQARPSAPGPDWESPGLVLRERGADGRGREVPDGFVVLKGSRARGSEVESIHQHLRELRKQLQVRGVLEADGEDLVFTQDFRFGSPSMAAGVLVGASANGRRAWKDERGVTLKMLQAARTEAGE